MPSLHLGVSRLCNRFGLRLSIADKDDIIFCMDKNTIVKLTAMALRYAIIIALAFMVYRLKSENRQLKAELEAVKTVVGQN